MCKTCKQLERLCNVAIISVILRIANKIEQLEEIIRAWGQNPEEILTKDALLRGNISETQEICQNHQLSLLANQLKQLVRSEVSV